jgi:hypothetical protein
VSPYLPAVSLLHAYDKETGESEIRSKEGRAKGHW